MWVWIKINVVTFLRGLSAFCGVFLFIYCLTGYVGELFIGVIYFVGGIILLTLSWNKSASNILGNQYSYFGLIFIACGLWIDEVILLTVSVTLLGVGLILRSISEDKIYASIILRALGSCFGVFVVAYVLYKVNELFLIGWIVLSIARIIDTSRILRILGSCFGVFFLTYGVFLLVSEQISFEAYWTDKFWLVGGLILLSIVNYRGVIRGTMMVIQEIETLIGVSCISFAGFCMLDKPRIEELFGTAENFWLVIVILLTTGIFFIIKSNFSFFSRIGAWTKKELLAFYHWFSRNFVLIIRVLGSGLGVVLLLPGRFSLAIKFVDILKADMKEIQNIFFIVGIFLLVVCNIRFIWLLLRIVWKGIIDSLTRAASWLIRNGVMITRVCVSFIGLLFVSFGGLSFWFSLFETQMDFLALLPGIFSEISALVFLIIGTFLLVLGNLNFVRILILRIGHNIRLFAYFMAGHIARAYSWLVRNKWSILRGVGTFFGIFLGFVVSVEHLTDTQLLHLSPPLVYLIVGFVLVFLSNLKVFKRIFLKIWELSYRLCLFIWKNIKSFAFWIKKELIVFYHWFSRNRSLIMRVLGSGVGLIFLLLVIFASALGIMSQFIFFIVGILLLVVCNYRFIGMLLRIVWIRITNSLTRAARWLIQNRVLIIRVSGSFVGLLFVILSFDSLFIEAENLQECLCYWFSLVRVSPEYVERLPGRILEMSTEIFGTVILILGASLLIFSNFKVSKRIFLEIWELSYRLVLVIWKNIKSFAFWVANNSRAIMRVIITGLGVFIQGIGVVYLLYERILELYLYEQNINIEWPFELLVFTVFGVFLCIIANPQEFRTLVRAIKNKILSIWRWIRTEKVLVARTLILLIGFYLVTRWIFLGKPLLQTYVTYDNEFVTKLDYFLPFASILLAFIDYIIEYLIVCFITIRKSLKLTFAWMKKHFTEIRKLIVTFFVSFFWLIYLVFQEPLPGFLNRFPDDIKLISIFGLGLAILILNYVHEIKRVIKSFVQALQEALRWIMAGFKKLIVFFKEWTMSLGMVLLALVFLGFGSYMIIFQVYPVLFSDLSMAGVNLSIGLGCIAMAVILFWLVNKRRESSLKKV